MIPSSYARALAASEPCLSTLICDKKSYDGRFIRCASARSLLSDR
jgi:hypothetical protein